MARRFVRLIFNFTCSFAFMINVYYDVNLFERFQYFSTYLSLPIGGETQSQQDVPGDSNTWGILGGNGLT